MIELYVRQFRVYHSAPRRFNRSRACDIKVGFVDFLFFLPDICSIIDYIVTGISVLMQWDMVVG